MFGTTSPSGSLYGSFVANARRSLQAEHLKAALAMVEAKAGVRSRHTVKEIASIIELLKGVPDYRKKIGTYPLWSLLAIYLLAVLCGAPRGSKDLAKFARKLSQGQRRALGVRQRQGRYPAPSQPTFWRMLEEVNGTQLQEVLLQVQEQLRGPAPQNELIAMDGKEPKHGGGQSVLTAVCVPSQYYLGSAMVDTKTNEIPVAQKLFPDLDLKGRFVSLDALHTQTQTARDIVLEGGGDYLLTVKDNQQKLHQNIEKLLPAPKADFPPLAADAHGVSHLRVPEEGPQCEPLDPHPSGLPGAGLLSAGRTGGPACSAKPRAARMKMFASLPVPSPKNSMPRSGWSLIAPVSAASKTVCISVWTFPTTMIVAGFAIPAACSWPAYCAGSATASSWSGALTNLIPSI